MEISLLMAMSLIKIFSSHFHDLWIKLIAINRDISIHRSHLARGCPRGKTDDRDTFDIRRFTVCIKIGTHQKLIPGTVVLQDVGVVNGVYTLPFIQSQYCD